MKTTKEYNRISIKIPLRNNVNNKLNKFLMRILKLNQVAGNSWLTVTASFELDKLNSRKYRNPQVYYKDKRAREVSFGNIWITTLEGTNLLEVGKNRCSLMRQTKHQIYQHFMTSKRSVFNNTLSEREILLWICYYKLNSENTYCAEV